MPLPEHTISAIALLSDEARHRAAIEDAVARLKAGAPGWEVASRLTTHLLVVGGHRG